MTLRTWSIERGDWHVLRMCGDMDLLSSPELRRRLHEAVAEGRRDVVIDLSDVVICDSTGVGVLIAARRLLRSCGGRLRLVLPGGCVAGVAGPSHVERVLSALGVRRLFDVYGDLDSALDDAGEPLSA
ncbi:STAS domain-containing protein [Streptomyces polyrhachis]|uniref:STAS domain-containing protein n=1 Tax=Streptomyces polyrhachis TaxID=1282885 RepID=A0ABW2GEH5_9ACTN